MLYSNAYIYCLPSDVEGMPISLLEAMSYGNCCLISNIEENTEVVMDKAITFKKGDVEDLKDKLEMMIEKKELVRKYKLEASKYILDKFSWNDTADQTIRLYQAAGKYKINKDGSGISI
jgi:glycosyltransferase involved in cell wall biosynthesis